MLLALGLAASTCFLTLILPNAFPNTRAIILMRLGLVMIWVVSGGALMYLLREQVRLVLQNIRIDPRILFTLFATFLALVEELVTTTLTNLAPLFGVPVGAAYITASSNYFDVVCLHSVVVFIPMFLCWALLLQRYSFSPNAVFFLFGLTGVAAEALHGGMQAVLDANLWVFVYGLMVYLPAYAIMGRMNARQPRWWHYGLAIFLPFVFAIPVAIVVSLAHPIQVHFPPLQPGT